MGTLESYSCNKCDYSADISGGPDMGMLVKTDTFICLNCNEVVDVVTEYCIDETPDESSIGKCPECNSSKYLKKWDNKKRPCPKCDGKLKKSFIRMTEWD